MTVLQKKEHNPVAHLTPEDIENLGKELDAIRQRVLDERGEQDAAYIRTVIATQRKLELGSRAVLLASMFPPAWILGTIGLSVAKILENMELGKNLRKGRHKDPAFRARAKEVLVKIRKQVTKDYLVHPALSGPSFLHTLAANFTANMVRNLWTNSVILCGHFPSGVETFERRSIVGETRGEWYLRQMLGSANIRLSLPNDFVAKHLDRPAAAPVAALVRRTPKRRSAPEPAAA